MNKNHLAVCINNDDYEVSLELRKIYELIVDNDAELIGMIRVIDESGEDYLYPKDFFAIVDLPEIIEKQILLAA
jgi:hypothetical protein